MAQLLAGFLTRGVAGSIPGQPFWEFWWIKSTGMGTSPSSEVYTGNAPYSLIRHQCYFILASESGVE